MFVDGAHRSTKKVLKGNNFTQFCNKSAHRTTCVVVLIMAMADKTEEEQDVKEKYLMLVPMGSGYLNARFDNRIEALAFAVHELHNDPEGPIGRMQRDIAHLTGLVEIVLDVLTDSREIHKQKEALRERIEREATQKNQEFTATRRRHHERSKTHAAEALLEAEEEEAIEALLEAEEEEEIAAQLKAETRRKLRLPVRGWGKGSDA